ncbi:MAG: S24/S26 family peptidase [Eubacteriales bacterium]|nr:S24/S26 family peptidase [Eubacteriales bacterium]
MNSRVVANEVYIPVVRELLEEGKEVSLTVSGNSMSPFFIHTRDKVLLGPVDDGMHKGDIAIFQRKSGQFVLHRICRVSEEGQYFFIGDAQTQAEGPVGRNQIFGKVKAVCRKGTWLKPGDFWWEFFEHVWLRMIPARRLACRCYDTLKKLTGGLQNRKKGLEG